jgi:hypothetical protein
LSSAVVSKRSGSFASDSERLRGAYSFRGCKEVGTCDHVTAKSAPEPHSQRGERKSSHRRKALTAFGVVMLTWDERTQLLVEMRHLDSLEPVRREFEGAGTSRPVKIPQALKPAVAQVIEMWGKNTHGGLRALPDGIFELPAALTDESDRT